MTGHINLTPPWGKTVTELTAPGRQTTRPAGTTVAHAPDGQSRAILGPGAPRGAAAQAPDGALYPYLTEDAPEVITMVTKTGTAQTTANQGVTDAAAAQTTANTGVTNAATAQSRADLAHTYLSDANVRILAVESWRAVAGPQLSALTDPTTGAGPRLFSLETSRSLILADLASASGRINDVVIVNNQQNADLASAGSQLVSLNSQMGVLTHPSTGVGARLFSAESRLGGHDADLASASGRINGKADSSTVSALDVRVGGFESGLAGKASNSDVQSGLNSVVSAARNYVNALSAYVEANFQKTGSGSRPIWPS